jgi:hypothetical protein
MFQRGLDLVTLDTSYVSSVSWYFLLMYGLNDFFNLVFGGSSQKQETTDSEMILFDLGCTPGQGGPVPDKFDPKAAIKEEMDNLDITNQKPFVDEAEKRLLGKRYPKRRKNDGTIGNPGDDIFGFGKMPNTVIQPKTKAGTANSQKKKVA